jgi:hypothetical protein
MSTSTSSPSLAQPATRTHWLAAAVLLAALVLLWHGPIAQWPGYHAFADSRAWLGLPNAANVLSNLPFAVIGLWGLWRIGVQRRAALGAGALGWALFAFAVACTALGSAVYHWAPSNFTLVFDRLPIAWACAALACAFLAERVAPAWGRAGPLALALLGASLSVAWWWFTEQGGAGDLRPYLFVQFLPMLLVPLVLLLKIGPGGGGQVSGSAWWTVLALYAAAKGFEVADHAVLQALHFSSGHTLKHLLAAAAAWWMLRAASGASALNSGSRR